MKISKVTSISKNGIRSLNEDRVLVDESKSIFGVFDGATSLDSYVSPDGRTGAYIAADTAAQIFAQLNGSLVAVAKAANDAIENAHKEADINVAKAVNRFGTTVSVVKIVDDQLEMVQIGDSVILVVAKDGQIHAPLGYHDHDINIMRTWRRLADEGITDIRAHIEDDLLNLRESSNIAYGVLNGDSNAENFIKTGNLDLANIKTVLLLTDGLYIPKADPDALEDWETNIRLYHEGGLQKMYDIVRSIEGNDPHLAQYPRYKMHDDASGVAIELIDN